MQGKALNAILVVIGIALLGMFLMGGGVKAFSGSSWSSKLPKLGASMPEFDSLLDEKKWKQRSAEEWRSFHNSVQNFEQHIGKHKYHFGASDDD